MFVILRTTSDHFSKIDQYLGRYGAKKTPKSDHFMDAESIKKTLNFTTTYPVLMRSATELYLNKIFQFAKSWGITHRV